MARTGFSSGSGTGGSKSGSGSLGDSRPSRGSGGSAQTRGSGTGRDAGSAHLCTFRVGGQRYALSTALVRELLEVTAITRVPRTDPAVLGLFNLRGEPMPLVDLALVLGMPTAPIAGKAHVIIIRSEELSIGARIEAIGSVVPNSGIVAAADSSPLLAGFLPAAGAEGPVAVIQEAEFLRRLGNLRVARTDARTEARKG
jgi:chemotaxis signal transduction protein